MNTKIITLFIAILTTLPSLAADLRAEAAAAYKASDNDKACRLYNEILASEADEASAADFFNAGNAFVKAGNYGSAVLNYERALRLDPGSDQIRGNLEYAEGKVEDRNLAALKGNKTSVKPDQPTFFEAIGSFISRRVSSDFWATLAIICFALMIGGIACYIFSRPVILRKIGFFGSITMLFASVILIIFSAMAAKARNDRDRCVLTAFKTQLAPEPGTEPQKEPFLNAGTVFTIISVEENAAGKPEWYKVRLNSDFTGWVKAADVTVI